jgi:hypothetical protein
VGVNPASQKDRPLDVEILYTSRVVISGRYLQVIEIARFPCLAHFLLVILRLKKYRHGRKSMILRVALIAALGLVVTAGVPAQAGLIGNGTNTVVVTYQFPGGSEIEGNGGAPDTIAIGTTGVTIPEGALDGTLIMLTDTQIIFKNLLPAEFCDTAGQHPCADAFNGFEFKFSSGVDIIGASVDAASASDFRPTGSGVDLASSTDLRVNVASDTPRVNDELILDLDFAPSTVPEPDSILLLGACLAGLFGARQIHRTRRA